MSKSKETAEATKLSVPTGRDGDMAVLVLAIKRNLQQSKPNINVQTNFLLEIGAADLISDSQRKQYDALADDVKIGHTSTVETRRLAELVLTS